MCNLPLSWRYGIVNDAASSEKNAIVDGPFGSNLKLSDYVEDGPVPVLTTKNLEGHYDDVRYISHQKFEELRRSEVRGGDILMAKIGSCGKTGVYPENYPSAIIPANLLKMTVGEHMNRSYVLYYFQSPDFTRLLETITKSTAQPAFGISSFKLLGIPIAPIAEQQRIVAEIETQFSRLDAGVAALKRVRANLKRYRASVLRAACEGRLVPTEAELAAAEGRAYEPADVLLTRLLAERRERWEAEQLAKMEAQGRLPLNDAWRGKYQEPAAPDTSSSSTLPQIPTGWTWCSLAALTANIGDVDHKMPRPAETDIPYISTKDFKGENEIDFSRAKRISEQDYLALCRKIKPELGDILLSRYGTVGEVRLVNVDRRFQASYSVAIIKALALPSAHYLIHSLRSAVVQEQIKRDIRATAQPDLGLEYIRQFAIPLPPLAEQERIVAELERRLSFVDELETLAAANLKRAERLRQSLLQQAFSGRLVPQDPADEPAGALLERIRAERAAPANGTTARAIKGKTRKPISDTTPQEAMPL